MPVLQMVISEQVGMTKVSTIRFVTLLFLSNAQENEAYGLVVSLGGLIWSRKSLHRWPVSVVHTRIKGRDYGWFLSQVVFDHHSPSS